MDPRDGAAVNGLATWVETCSFKEEGVGEKEARKEVKDVFFGFVFLGFLGCPHFFCLLLLMLLVCGILFVDPCQMYLAKVKNGTLMGGVTIESWLSMIVNLLLFFWARQAKAESSINS